MILGKSRSLRKKEGTQRTRSAKGSLKRPKEYGRNGFWAGWERLSEHSTPSGPSLWKGQFVCRFRAMNSLLSEAPQPGGHRQQPSGGQDAFPLRERSVDQPGRARGLIHARIRPSPRSPETSAGPPGCSNPDVCEADKCHAYGLQFGQRVNQFGTADDSTNDSRYKNLGHRVICTCDRQPATVMGGAKGCRQASNRICALFLIANRWAGLVARLNQRK